MSSPDELRRRALPLIGGDLAALAAKLLHGADGETETYQAPAADATAGTFWAGQLADAIDRARTDRRPSAKVFGKENRRVAVLVAPLDSASGQPLGTLALACPVDNRGHAHEKLAILSGLAALLPVLGVQIERRRVFQQHMEHAAAGAQQGEMLDALSHASGAKTVRELAFGITNNLRAKLDCDLVALGRVRRRRVKVLSISGFADFSQRSSGVADVAAAMEEALDNNQPVVSQDVPTEPKKTSHRLHEKWRSASENAAVASVPLQVDGRTVAVLALRHRPNQTWDVQTLEKVAQVVQPYAAAIGLVEQAHRGIARHAAASTTSLVKRSLIPHRSFRWALGVVGLAFSAWVAFGTIEYRVTAPCVVEPSAVRHVTSGLGGRVVQAFVKPGDTVARGEVLAILDTRELALERAEVQGELLAKEAAANAAAAEGDSAAMKVLGLEADAIRMRLMRINLQLDQAVVRAPSDGVVISGGARELLGQGVTKGTPLFEVAAWEDLVVAVHVPDHAADEVRQELVGTFALQAKPDDKQPLTVRHVAPLAEAQAGAVTFRAEAAPGEVPEWVRPGMKGVARIEAGQRPVWWVAVHRGLDWARVNFWI